MRIRAWAVLAAGAVDVAAFMDVRALAIVPRARSIEADLPFVLALAVELAGRRLDEALVLDVGRIVLRALDRSG